MGIQPGMDTGRMEISSYLVDFHRRWKGVCVSKNIQYIVQLDINLGKRRQNCLFIDDASYLCQTPRL